MDFSLTDEQKMIQQTVRRFVERELMPLENEALQNEGKYPTGVEPELYESLQMKAKEMGFWGINTPEEYGGANLGAVMTALIWMELGKTASDWPGSAVTASAFCCRIAGAQPAKYP